MMRVQYARVNAGVMFDQGDGEFAILRPHKLDDATHNFAAETGPKTHLLAKVDSLSHKPPGSDDMHNNTVANEGDTCTKTTSNDHASWDRRQC
jgi:hypothetical protein